MPNLPWFIPLLWPEANILAAVSSTASNGEDTKMNAAPLPLPVAQPTCTIKDHVTSCVAATRSFLLALFCVYVVHGGTDPDSGYPAFGRGKTLAWSWVLPLIVRNIVGTWIIAGGWDWFLYFSPMSKALSRYKMNQVYPSKSQIRHDAIYTTLASLLATCIEIALCHAWANSTPWGNPASVLTLSTWIQGITLVHWRNPHFYLIHRLMHPWKIRGVPKTLDPGCYLYKHVHALHHKSHNPTAFSGTNMHPIEATLYYSVAFLPVLLFPGPIHPAVAVACLVDCGVGAWLGHDGFQWPGAGDYYHLLHHQYFDCNYGTPQVPLDYWFGTFAADKGDVKAIWRATAADVSGEDENGLKLH